MVTQATDEEATRRVGAELASRLVPGDVVFLTGPLGAGKTTLVRGALAALGWAEPVRSPTFPIIVVYPTVPSVVHCDLYRVPSAEGLGLEDDLATHVVFVEWPDRAGPFFDGCRVWRVAIDFLDGEEGRTISVEPP